MRLGMHLRELSRRRVGLAVSALVALLAAVWSVADVSLLPPKLTSRSTQIGTAYTQVVVDTPQSAALDLAQDTDALTNRALLVGDVMASPAVRGYIARRAGVAPGAVQVVAPRTPAQPRPLAQPGRKQGPRDILRSTDQYRLDIQANPTVPFLNVYAQAPTAAAAANLANAAVDGLGEYLRVLASSQRPPRALQVRLRQLGRAQGHVINPGVSLQLALVTFVLVFGAACAATILLARVRGGWRLETAAQQ